MKHKAGNLGVDLLLIDTGMCITLGKHLAHATCLANAKPMVSRRLA